MFSKLDIINAMVITTGSRPLTASNSQHPSYMKAEAIINRVSLTVLQLGLWFNTECREIPPTADNEIVVPQGCIKADPADRNHNFTLRGNRMYDLDTGTYEVTEAVRLKMIFDVPLEDMPVTAQSYIQACAIYEFYLNEDGADPKLSHYRATKQEAWGVFYREHLRSQQINVFDNPNNAVNTLRRGNGGAALLRGGNTISKWGR